MNSILGPYCGFSPSIVGNHMFGGNYGFPMINQFGGNTQICIFDQIGMPVNYGFPSLRIPPRFTNSPFFLQTKPQKETTKKVKTKVSKMQATPKVVDAKHEKTVPTPTSPKEANTQGPKQTWAPKPSL